MISMLSAPKLINIPEFNDDRGLMQIISEGNFHTKIIKMTTSREFSLRGFHFQKPPLLQKKIVFLIEGEIQDVLLKVNSEGKPLNEFVEFRLKANSNNCAIEIPENWAHAYLTLSKESKLLYLCNEIYGNEISINPLIYDKWIMEKHMLNISKKDLNG
jgi:dTDP-4-dehydrorhamnose 3,5-epimerase